MNSADLVDAMDAIDTNSAAAAANKMGIDMNSAAVGDASVVDVEEVEVVILYPYFS